LIFRRSGYWSLILESISGQLYEEMLTNGEGCNSSIWIGIQSKKCQNRLNLHLFGLVRFSLFFKKGTEPNKSVWFGLDRFGWLVYMKIQLKENHILTNMYFMHKTYVLKVGPLCFKTYFMHVWSLMFILAFQVGPLCFKSFKLVPYALKVSS